MEIALQIKHDNPLSENLIAMELLAAATTNFFGATNPTLWFYPRVPATTATATAAAAASMATHTDLG